jgi:cytoskeletal protein RodZ
MWESIRSVSSVFTLVAFIGACIVVIIRRALSRETRMIETAPQQERGALVAAAIEKFRVDTHKLPAKQQYELLLAQLRERRRRLSLWLLAWLLVCILFLSAFIWSTRITTHEHPAFSTNSSTTPQLIIKSPPPISLPDASNELNGPKASTVEHRPKNPVPTASKATRSEPAQVSPDPEATEKPSGGHAVETGHVQVGDHGKITIGNINGSGVPDVGVKSINAGSNADISIGNKSD